MFHTLLVLCFCSCLIGVFGDEVKSVSVMEGQNVTLHTDLTHIQTHDAVEWRFKDIRISRIKRSFNINPIYDETEIFRDRVKMNNQTGDLTITHITSQHSGLYKLYILGRNKDTVKIFNLTVHDEVKSVSVMEGHSVTLHTDLTHIQTDDVIEWRFKDILIARIMRSDNINPTYDETEIFRDKLKMNNQTVDLTITHITSQHSGLYHLNILRGNTERVKRFNLTVNDADKHPIDQHDEAAADVHHTEGETHLVYIIPLSCAAVGCVMIVSGLLMFFICRKHTNTRRQQQQQQDQTHEDEITYADPTFYKRQTQNRRGQEEDDVVYAGVVTRR